MGKIASAYQALGRVLVTYPALSAALVNVGVIVAGYFGLHISADQLIYFAGVVAVLLGAAVHQSVTPVAKLVKK